MVKEAEYWEKEHENVRKRISAICASAITVDDEVECGLYAVDNQHIECEPFHDFCVFELDPKKVKEA